MIATEAPSAAVRPIAALRRNQLLGLVLLVGVGFVTLLPIMVVVLGSFEGDTWAKVADSERTRGAIGYSIIVALRAPFAAIIGFFIAWLLIRIRIPGREAIELMFWIAFFLPLIPVTLGWVLLLDSHDGLVNTLLMTLPFVDGPVFNIHSVSGIIWVHMTASSVPIMIILLGPAIRQFDASMEEAARVCGSAPLTVFRRITVPLLLPAILTGTVLAFIRGLEAFEVERLLGNTANIYVYTTYVYSLINWEPPRFSEAQAVSTVVLVLLLLLALLYQKINKGGGFVTISGSGMSLRSIEVSQRTGRLLAGSLVLLLVITLALPMTFVVIGSMMKLFGLFGVNDPFTLSHWLVVLGDQNFPRAVGNTLILSLSAAAIGVFAYAGTAYLLVRTRWHYRSVTEILAWLPWCIPGILLGLGLLTLVLFTPGLNVFYGGLAIMIFAIMISQLPLGVNMMKTSIAQISPDLEYASRVCGGGTFVTFRRIVLPLMKPMLISIFVLVTIAGIRDVSTVLLLAQPKSLPLSVLMLEYAVAGETEKAAVVGIVTTAIICVIVLLARRWGLQIGQR